MEALIQLLMVPPIKLMDRGMDASKYTFLLTRCLVKASRILPERYKVCPPVSPPPSTPGGLILYSFCWYAVRGRLLISGGQIAASLYSKLSN